MNIINIFDNVWIEEKNIDIDNDCILQKIPIKYNSRFSSRIDIPFIYSFPDGFCSHFKIILECKKCKKLYKEVITNTNILYVKIGVFNYLSRDYIFPLYTDKNKFTVFDFLLELRKKWEEIYQEEDEYIKQNNIQNETKKDESDSEDEEISKYGIRCHGLGDLSVYNISSFAYTTDNIPLISFSSDS